MADRMPAWFLAHGAPLHLQGDQPVRRFWQGLSERLPRQPRAVLCLSAHWLTATPCLAGDVDTPRIQHDFYGFPDELYQIQWPLTGSPATAEWLKSRIAECLTTLDAQPERPFDHGVWVPLINTWPKPEFPIYQLSLCPERGAHWHLELGRQLAPLRDENVLIIGSGGIVHNLARIDWHAKPGHPTPWAAAFMQAIEVAIAHRNFDALSDPWSLPHGRDCVPTIEHYLPLLVMLGTGIDEQVIPLYRDWEYGSLALHSYAVTRLGKVKPERITAA
jgi:4,5-DOPA dioxygenase extradiol